MSEICLIKSNDMKPGSSITASIIKGTCPRCHGDHMYINANPYAIGSIMKMHTKCNRCGLHYKVEPNFFFGAMYVSYGVAVFTGLVIFAVAYLLFKSDIDTAFISIFAGLFLLMPLITRISRNIYIALFVGYRRELDV